MKETDKDAERLQQERREHGAAAGGARGSVAQPDQDGMALPGSTVGFQSKRET